MIADDDDLFHFSDLGTASNDGSSDKASDAGSGFEMEPPSPEPARVNTPAQSPLRKGVQEVDEASEQHDQRHAHARKSLPRLLPRSAPHYLSTACSYVIQLH